MSYDHKHVLDLSVPLDHLREDAQYADHSHPYEKLSAAMAAAGVNPDAAPAIARMANLNVPFNQIEQAVRQAAALEKMLRDEGSWGQFCAIVAQEEKK